jgi:hypothetical protein
LKICTAAGESESEMRTLGDMATSCSELVISVARGFDS